MKFKDLYETNELNIEPMDNKVIAFVINNNESVWLPKKEALKAAEYIRREAKKLPDPEEDEDESR